MAARAWADCRERWRPLLAAGGVIRLGSALLLPAVYALLLRLVIAGSGKSVLTDLDLLYFATSPLGLLGLVILSVATAVTVAVETGILLTILSQPAGAASATEATRSTLWKASRFGRIATRAVLEALLWLAPAAIVAAVTYAGLLSDFDINYYLAERPQSFWIAMAIAGVLAFYLALVGLKLATDWALAIPIALYEPVEPGRIRREGQERTARNRWTVRGWIAAWFVGTLLLSSATTLAVGAGASVFSQFWPRSLSAVAAGIGLALAVLVVTSLAVNFVSSVALAAILRQLYLRLGGSETATRPSEASTQQGAFWLTKKRFLAGIAVALLAVTTAGFMAIGSVPVRDQVLVIGHRGSPQSAPGNTMASFRSAIEEGADWVEIDVQETADGEVVVFHDSDFMKAAGLDLKIWDATTDRLSTIDLGSRFSPEFAGERIPTFAQVLEACRGKAGVLVELKYYGHDVALEERVVEIVERLGMVDQTMFMSLHRPGIEKLQTLRPEWRTGLLLSVAVGGTSSLEADFLGVNSKFASRGMIRSSHRAEREVYAWTVNDPVTMSSLISRGVDGLITDLPATARAVLAERAEMPPVTRLLVDLADRFRIASLLPTTPTAPAEQ